jgi:hypothetical protein
MRETKNRGGEEARNEGRQTKERKTNKTRGKRAAEKTWITERKKKNTEKTK